MQEVIGVEQRSLFQKVLVTFIFSLFISTVGLYVGQYVPPAYFLPLAIAELVMLVAAFMLRKKKSVGYGFTYAFSFVSGITLFPIVSFYASVAGAQVVLYAFGSTFVIFTVMGVIGAKTKKDLGFLGSFLLVALLALVCISIFSLFSPLTTPGLMAFSVIGTIVFSLYVLYDFNKMKHGEITEELVPLLALSLYLDFINLFINLLRFFGILGSDD
ncbi:Bax inhibitor-1/YccA family protein [Priestia megaterium]|uniref:Bax inhibitor-1/YccA family protein n=1 Tax=Priestia megaterium TaxID=1404 RepID=UPI001455AACF|nr:Bax inhibitor-1/YccA family protein [Priestia megaterium]